MILIVNYGMGNLGSIQNMFQHIGVPSKISSDLQELDQASKILLPGVGAFDAAMNRINNLGFLEVLNKKALEDKIPVLGICLGMQLLTKSSDEGKLPGLGWVPASTRKFIARPKLPVPHMGWNEVQLSNENPLYHGLEQVATEGDLPRFYFVHSYYVTVEDEKYSAMKTEYDIRFDSAIMHENVFGCQFHPEKSHRFGMTLLKNFSKL